MVSHTQGSHYVNGPRSNGGKGSPPMTILESLHARAPWVVVLAGRGLGMAARSGPADAVRPPFDFDTHRARAPLRQTLVHALELTSSDQIIVVFTSDQRDRVLEALDGEAPGLLLEQPRDCGTGPAMLLALAYLLESDPDATVVILPADSCGEPEQEFREQLESAVDLARRSGRLVVLGATSQSSRIAPAQAGRNRSPNARSAAAARDPVEPGAALEAAPGPRTDRPGGSPRTIATMRVAETSAAPARRGVWNTGIAAVPAAEALWTIGRQYLPAATRSFETVRHVLRSVRSGGAPPEHEQLALTHAYRQMPAGDLTRDLLDHAIDSIHVVRMEGAGRGPVANGHTGAGNRSPIPGERSRAADPRPQRSPM